MPGKGSFLETFGILAGESFQLKSYRLGSKIKTQIVLLAYFAMFSKKEFGKGKNYYG